MKNCFFIEPYVHITAVDQAFSLYNVLNGEIIESKDDELVAMINHMVKTNKNIYFLTNEECIQVNFKNFIKESQVKYIGDLYVDNHLKSPLNYGLSVNINKDINEIKKDKIKLDSSIKNYLAEITVFLNSGNNKFIHIKDGYKQLNYPPSNNSVNFLKPDTVINIIKDSYRLGTSKVNIVLGDLQNYPDIGKIISYLKAIDMKSTLYIHYKDFECNKNQIENAISENFNINLLFNSFFNISEIKEMISNYSDNFIFTFIIQDEKEYIFIENNLLLRYNLRNYEIKPFFNGQNLEFFRNNVFIEKEDILNNKHSHRQLKLNQYYNSNNFGKIYFLNDGKVYTNPNLTTNGDIEHNSLEEILQDAILNPNSGWLKTRNRVNPCRKCIYNCLCPAISNYEYTIGKFNLCNIVN
ncbi:MAG: TIGR04150 pseudo-rSAM protein [Bacteroidetes bacterium]|nr:TIGR04150 pseudo-rSAM protein [Bacteroidota bacterium]